MAATAPDRSQRVPLAHAQARASLRLALAFVALAAGAAALGAERWVPLHLVLAGGVALAISGTTVMLAVTWSAAPPPHLGLARVQRWSVATGVAGVVVARELSAGSAALGAAGATYVVGLLLLGHLLVAALRGATKRRFDPAVVAYLLGLAAGLAGVALGVAMAVEVRPELRSAHLTSNLLGFVGLVVAGTLPFFASTVGRSKMAPRATRRRLLGADAWLAAALSLAVIALVVDAPSAAAGGLAAYALGLLHVAWLLPRPTRRQLRWAGPRLVALWAGLGWWVLAVGAAAVEASRATTGVLAGRWLLVLVVGAYLQVLWGSLAYLLPMLRGGGPDRLAAGFAATRSWLGLVAANGAALALALRSHSVAGVLMGLWTADAAVRAARVRLGARAAR